MSDFMMSQVQGLLAKVADDLEKMGENTTAQTDMLLGAINDLAANMFATQAILAVLLRDHPVDAKQAKAWIIINHAERDPQYRERIAESLYRGVAKYVNGLSGLRVAQNNSRIPGN